MLDQLSKTRQGQSKDSETQKHIGPLFSFFLPYSDSDQHLQADVATNRREVTVHFVSSQQGAFQN